MIDHSGRNITYLRLSVTELCNLRCRYCMPEEGVCKKRHEDMLTEEEMLLAVRAAASLGVTKLRITGGEPLVKKNILSICRKAAEIPGIRELCITTNGILLPQYAGELKAAGMDHVNISLDTLDPEKYTRITRIGKLEDALRGLDAALGAGFRTIRLNTVLIGGFNDDEIPALAELTRNYPLDVRFIELMPMNEEEVFGEGAYLPGSTVLERLPDLRSEAPDGGVARLYRFPGAPGRVGLISPISSHFCGSCNRIRLTADGKLKPCLHSADEYPVKGLGYEEMVRQFERAVSAKPAWHGEMSAESRSRSGRSMNQIGG